MTEVDAAPRLEGMELKEAIAGSGSNADTDSSSAIFVSCMSDTPPGSEGSYRKNRSSPRHEESADQITIRDVPISKSPSVRSREEPICLPADNATERAFKNVGLEDCCTRYGLEPMELILGSADEAERKEEEKTKYKAVPDTDIPATPPKRHLTIRRIGDYDLVKTIGSGSTGKVKLAIHRVTCEKLAVKIVPRKQLDPKKRASKEGTESRETRILREAAILNLIDHEHIVKLKDFLITEDYFCLFFEYIDGVQLLDYIISHGKLDEKQARSFFRQILSAVDYCHHNSIVHRDLKIENILVERTGKIKLLDFGLSNFYHPENQLNTFCGSLYFAAPELLSGRVYTGPEVDVWSLGIILYVFVCGKVPFDDKSLAALHDKIKACRLHVPDYLSFGCRNLLSRMICKYPSQRASMDDVILDPWVSIGYDSVPAFLPDERLPIDMVDENIVAFLAKEFAIQYSVDEIRSILSQATIDWASAFKHPLISLYFLVKDKLFRDGASIGTVAVSIDPSERSRSLSNIEDCRDSSSSLMTPSEAHYTSRIGRKWSAPGSTITTSRIEEAIPAYEMITIKENDAEGGTKFGSYFKRLSLKDSSKDSAEERVQEVPSTSSYTYKDRFKSKSLGDAQAITSSAHQDEILGIKTVYFKGLFSVNTSSNRSPIAIRNEIQQFLMLRNIRFEDHRSHFVCEHRPSVIKSREGLGSPNDCLVGRVHFEVHIVRLAFLSMYGIQFKRLHGDAQHYRNLCAQMIAALKL